MKKCIRILSLLLPVVMLTGLLTTMSFAANYSTNYKQYSAPSSSDYAYWNGSRVVRASGTTTSEMSWMQASLNWCVANLGLQADYVEVDGSLGPASRATVIAFQKAAGLTADGSFGPACIQRMKDILNGKSLTWISASDSITVKPGTTATLNITYGGTPIHSIGGSYRGEGLAVGITDITWTNDECSATIQITASSSFKQSGSVTFNLLDGSKRVLNSKTICIVPKSTSSNSSQITTASIQAVLNKYGYKTGMYWTYPSGGSPNSGYYPSTRAGRAFSYNYYGSVECAGFAGFVMGEVTGKEDIMSGNDNGWKRIDGKNVTSLQVGDIIRAGNHSAVVLSVDSKGNYTFAECWGSVDCKINIGKFNGRYSTLKAIKAAYPNSFSHIWRYSA